MIRALLAESKLFLDGITLQTSIAIKNKVLQQHALVDTFHAVTETNNAGTHRLMRITC